MAARFVAGRDQHVLAVLHAFDLALHDSQFCWISFVVGRVDGEKQSLDALQPGRGIVVTGSLVQIQQVVGVGGRWFCQTLIHELIGLLPRWRRLVSSEVYAGEQSVARLGCLRMYTSRARLSGSMEKPPPLTR
jgi:hypothetical protein